MKYLKSIFEELKPETYIKVGQKLTSLGHKSRGQKLLDWGKQLKNERLEAFGVYDLDICKTTWDSTTKRSILTKQFTGQFYIEPVIEMDVMMDNLYEFIGDPGMIITLPFELGIIPLDEVTLEKCSGLISDYDYQDGTFWIQSLWVPLSSRGVYEVNPNLDPLDYDFIPRDNVGFRFSNRQSAARFRSNFIKSIRGLNTWGSKLQPTGLRKPLEEGLKRFDENFDIWIKRENFNNPQNLTESPIGFKDLDKILTRLSRLSINPLYRH